ncbi:hypothetical protein [Streptomyces sp. NPDC093984]|uniref:hypothetical protein n=1 Tax=Streptomyces sp. NPDC093984 TaxID=3366052 RepID=UPI00382C47FC
MTLRTTTPYDADRAAFSREALARLALSSQAVGAANCASALVATRNDVDTGLGGRVSEALRLTKVADETLVRAVVYERERGATWAQIAEYLGAGAGETKERFAPELARWLQAFEAPYRLDETGRKLIPQLPTAAYDPMSAVRRLDLWAGLHVTINDRHAVSEGLPGRTPPHEDTDAASHATRPELDGRIGRGNVRLFLELLSSYLAYDFDDTDWDTIALGLEPTDDTEEVAAWYAYPLVGRVQTAHVHLALARPFEEDDEDDLNAVSVVVTGADSADLRLRIDTLMDALAA